MIDVDRPVPKGVELLMDTSEIKARIAYIRQHLAAPYEPTEELRRLVNEESARELRRLGVIQ